MIKLNDKEIFKEKYPIGEVIFKLEKEMILDKIFNIELIWENDEDLIKLMILCNFLDEKFPFLNRMLNIYYLPYARMDREIQTETEIYPNVDKYIFDFIKNLNFNSIIILDPHTNKIINKDGKITQIYPQPPKDINYDILILPDYGASFRYKHLLETFNDDKKIVIGNKIRNTSNGQIENYEFINKDFIDFKDKTCLILDDICSYGNTFIKCAKSLKKLGAKEIILFITHTEKESFEKGDLKNTDAIDQIFTGHFIGEEYNGDSICLK